MKTIIESHQSGLFSKKQWIPNLVAGLIVGIVALPLAMAFAIASGAKPEQGIYTAIVAGLIVSIFGGSRVQIAGPTGAFIVILAGITNRYGIDGLQIATLLAGIILILMGVARLGGVIKFIPYPVVLGFTAGIAIVIWVGQWSYFLGLPETHAAHFHEKLWQIIQVIPKLHPTTTAIGCLSLLILLFVNRVPLLKKIPAPLIVLVIATGIQSYYQFDGVATIGSAFGGIPTGLPTFKFPDLSVDRILELIGPAFTIAMLGAIESLLSAVIADGMAGTRHHSNRELIGQGLANIVSPLFGGFAATGAIARTATSIRNGATSPLAGIVHAVTLGLILLFCAPLAMNIPLSALSAILFIVAWNMSEAKHALRLVTRAPRADVIILIVTFLLTIFVDLVVAVNIGVILAILNFLFKMVSSIEVQQPTELDLQQDLAKCHLETLPSNIAVYSINGPFFFGAVESFEHALVSSHTTPEVLIFQLRWVPLVDITALKRFEDVLSDFHQRQVRVILCGATKPILSQLKKAGTIDLLGEENVLATFSQALTSALEK